MFRSVFFSYGSSDRATVTALAAGLESSDIQAWIDHQSIDAGSNWSAQIVAALEQCNLVVVALSQDSICSRYVHREVALALEAGKPLVPVYLTAVTLPAELRLHLAGIQHLDFPALGLQETVRRLVKAVEGAAEIESEAVAPGAAPAAPPTFETFTFLFTDIEGSTRLWENYPQVMSRSLARHDDLMRQSIAANEGMVFKTVGDAFCAAFRHPGAAIAATMAAQRALSAEPWPKETPLRVRMALHTGPAEVRDRDYYGPTLNRVARILAAGHGGQVLVSRSTVEAAGAGLPAEVELVPMGSHRLKDLLEPEVLVQLAHPDLPADLPPLKSLSVLPTNLPAQLTSFIGRQKELEEVRRLLEHSRLLTLTGTGGSGKTRLSLQVGAEALESYRDGVWLAELASVEDPELVTRAVAKTLSVKDEPNRSLEVTLAAALQGKQLLLILDNCEHLVDACARLAERLLRACPQLTILASSREPLQIAGEQVYSVPTLGLPKSDRRTKTEEILRSDAVRLFADRAALHAPSFTVTEHNGKTIGQICRRLDGIPLALELAAARVKVLPPERLLERLDDRFRLLTTGSRTALPRQQTLRALIDWSYDLLDERERRLFERLSVFAGGWTLTAAECVCADSDGVTGEGLEGIEILDLLASLVQKSLVMMSSESAGESRYRMLGTIRQYAQDRLRASGEFETRRRRHRDYYVAYAERAAEELTGPQQTEWFARLEQENDNLCAAMACCEDTAGEGNAGLCLAGALGFFWRTRGRQIDVRSRIETALASDCEACPSPERARGLTQAGMAARDQGDLDAAVRHLREALEVYRRLDDDRGVAASLNQLGVMARLQGNRVEAVALLEEALELVRGADDRIRIADVLNSLGSLALSAGEYTTAIERYEEALQLRRTLGDQTGMGVSLGNLGIVAIALGSFNQATRLFKESMKTGRETGDHGGIAFAAHYLGDLARRRGDFAAARRFLEESLSLARDAGAIVHQSFSKVALARLALDQGELETALNLARSAMDLSAGQNDRHGIIRATDTVGDVSALRGQAEEAQRLWAEADEERKRLGILLTPTEQAERDAMRAR